MAILSYNPTEIQSYLTSLGHVEAGGCTEIRILPKENYLVINRKREYVGSTVAGYYTDYEKAARDIAPFDGKAAIYATLNPCDLKLMRRAHNKLAFKVKATAKDEDIISILWFPFDVDPVRPADTPASNDELHAALACRDRIIREVFDPLGVPVIRGMSGNGGHGLIPLIGYPNNAETQAKIKRLLDWLSETYTDETVSVDTTVGNPSRIWKVYGTLAVKGDNTPDAPYRRAIIELPSTLERFDGMAIMDPIVPSGFQSTATSSTKSKASTASDGEYPHLDVDRYLAHYGVEAKRRDRSGDVVWRMDCPFNPDHKGDAQLRQELSGRMGFVCPHNSCQGRNWQDFRERYDPTPFFEWTGGYRTAKRQREYSGLPGSDPGASTIDAPGHRNEQYEEAQQEAPSESDEEKVQRQQEREVERLTNLAKRLRAKRNRKREILAALTQENRLNLDEAIVAGIVERLIPGLKPTSAREIMTTEYPEPKWAIPGFVPEGLTIFAGASKIGKSWLVLNWATAIACGAQTMGTIDVERGEILYAALEDNKRRIDKRLKQMLPDGTIPDGMHFLTLGELPILTEAVDLLGEYLDAHPDTRALFIDTYIKVKPPTKGRNIYDEDYSILGPLQEFALSRGIALVLVHHTTKSTTPENVWNEISGSMGVQGAMDAMLLLRRDSNGHVLHVTGKEIQENAYAVRFDKEFGLWTLLGDAREHNISEQRKRILDLLKKNGSDPNGEPMTPKNIATFLSMPVNNVKQLLRKLRMEGMVISNGGIYQVTDDNPDNPDNPDNLDNPDNPDEKSASAVIGYRAVTDTDNREEASDNQASAGSVIAVTRVIGDIANDNPKENSAFLHAWHSTCGGQMVYVEQLLPLAQQAGFDLTAHNFSPMTNMERILRDLADCPIDGLTVRCLGDGAYQLEAIEKSAPRQSIKPPRPHCQKCEAYTPHKLTTDPSLEGWQIATCERCGAKTYTRPEGPKGEELL